MADRRPSPRSSAATTTGDDASRPVLDAIRAVMRELRRAERTTTEPLALPRAQALALHALARRPARSLTELAARTHTDPSSASVVVARLVARGLVARTAAADDRRRAELALTASGRAMLRRGPTTAEARMRAALGTLGADRVASLTRQLDGVARRLQTDPVA